MNAVRLLLAVIAWLATAAHAVPAHYIVLREAADGALDVLHHSLVEVAQVPRLDPSPFWDGNGTRLEARLSARVVRDGATVFETDVSASRWLRGEFSDGAGGTHGTHLPLAERHYVLRLPAGPAGGRAVIGAPGGAPIAADGREPRLVIDLDVVPDRAAPDVAPHDVFPILAQGDPANRLDLLVVGDGYTSAERAKFEQDAANAAASFFSISPYNEYRSFVNLRGLFTASAQSGADKPACAETPGSAVVIVDTAFDATYCSSGIRRLIGVNASKILAAAAASPDWDKIMVLVNDAEYGGAGGSFIVASLHALSVPVLQHEFGHTFTRLADEYTTPFPGYPACSDAAGGSPCERNVTNVLSPLKWQGWVTAGTAIPTTATPSDPRAAGAWEGARYLASGVFRQCHNGLMRSISSLYFCKVDTEAFIARMYDGGWGSPAQGVSLVEPGTRSPSAASISAATGASVALSATVAAPSTSVQAQWRVDGAVVKSQVLAHGALASLAYTAQPGAHEVRLTVTDASAALLQPRSFEASWTVTGSGAGAPQVVASTAQLAFGGQSMRTTSPAMRVTFTNQGTLSASVTIGIAAPFAATHDCGTLAPNASCNADVVFTPTAEGAASGSLTATAGASTATVALSGTGERSLVTHYYRSILRRAPDGGGKAYWAGEATRLQGLGADLNEAWFAMAAAFFASAEYAAFARDDAGFVTDLYRTFFNRGPDSGGQAFWMGQLSQGMPREVLLASFMFSAEFGAFTQAIFGNTDARAEVDVVMDFYRGFLARLPDGGGFAHWVGRFRAAQCQGAAATNAEADSISGLFMSSPEYAGRARSNAAFVGDLYNAFLRRGGDLNGVRHWIGELDAGRLTRDGARRAFLGSSEFQARVSAILAQGCLSGG